MISQPSSCFVRVSHRRPWWHIVAISLPCAQHSQSKSLLSNKAIIWTRILPETMKKPVVRVRTPMVESLTQSITSPWSLLKCGRFDQLEIWAVQFRLMNRLKILSFEFQETGSMFQGRSSKLCSRYQLRGIICRDRAIAIQLSCL